MHDEKLTLRDRFAIAALPACMDRVWARWEQGRESLEHLHELAAIAAYKHADAMMVAREKKTPSIKTVEIKVGEEGWIAWSGGPCPVGHLAPVELLLRNNGVVTPAMPAVSADWIHRNNGHDIVAYRVVQP